MTVEEFEKVLEMEEEILQFSSFTNADAWELGNMVIQEAKRLGLTIAVRIRLNNGYTVFQYGMDGTNLLNEQWMTRKENTVKTLEESSLRFCMNLRPNPPTPRQDSHRSQIHQSFCFSFWLGKSPFHLLPHRHRKWN